MADELSEYAAGREASAQSAGASEMEAWLRQSTPELTTGPIEWDAFPTDRAPPTEQSTLGKAGRSVAELPRQAVGGASDAAHNALGLVKPALDPLVDWLNENVADLRYDPKDIPWVGGQPKTTTGQVVRKASEFLTGFVPFLKGMKALGLGATAAPLAAGALADFVARDPQEGRLADLWNAAGLPHNILTDYLASDPDDSAMEGRFKNALEGVLVGGMLEGVTRGARALRNLRHAGKQIGAEKAAENALRAQYGELTDDALNKVFGSSKRPLLEKVPTKALTKVKKSIQETALTDPEDVFGPRAIVDAGESSIFVNFRRIESADDVKAVIAQMADQFKGSVKEAQRGVQSHAQTVKLADDLGMTVGDLLSRRQGQPLNAETAIAARRLWAASGEQLLGLAKRAADPNSTQLDQFAFRRAMAVHHAIQAEVIGARTETARALNAWRIPVGQGIESARAVQHLVEESGGAGMSQDIARRLVILAQSGDPRYLAKFVEKGAFARGLDAVQEVWINGLLSNPTTHVVNTTSNTIVSLQQILERGVAQGIGEIRGAVPGTTVAPGEAAAMTHGLVSGIRDAWRAAAKAFRAGEAPEMLTKVDLPARRSVSAEAFRMSSETGLGRFVDFLGDTARIPGRFLNAEDAFFKSIGYRMELHAQALREATAKGLTGDELGREMARIMLDPPQHIRLAAADAALYNTFTNATGEVGKVFMRMRARVPATTFVMPFVRTPVNIARYTFERTPLAPLVAQWRADIMAGGARADIALARMATGTAAMMSAFDMADSGSLTGSGPPNTGEREAMTRQGWQPYSIKLGDKWYSYNRTDPIGSLFGFAADTAEAIRRGEMNEDAIDEWQELVAAGIAATSQTLINKTYLRGLAEFVELWSDPKRYGERYITNFVSSFLPATALMGNVTRAVDPIVREAHDPWAAVMAKIPGLSASLPPRRDLWGAQMTTESGIGKTYDFLSPARARQYKDSPIDAEIMRLAPIGQADNTTGAAPQRIGMRAVFDGVQINFKEWPEVYDEYVRLAGNALRHPAWKLGAKDYLDAVVTGSHPMSKVYQMKSDEMKLKFIQETVQQYRKLAQGEIMQDRRFTGFQMYVRAIQQDKLQQRLPVLGTTVGEKPQFGGMLR